MASSATELGGPSSPFCATVLPVCDEGAILARWPERPSRSAVWEAMGQRWQQNQQLLIMHSADLVQCRR